MLEIYSTGGGLHLEMTLNAVAAFFATDNALALVNIGLLIGVFVLIFQLIFGGDFMQAIKTYCIIGLIGGLSIADRSSVIIFDKTEGPLWFRTVDNVPTSVAYIGSFTSRVSDVLTTQIESVFSSPENLSYQRHGMLFGATLTTKSARWRAVTSAVHENLTNFMDQCVIDAVNLRYITPDMVTRSGNLEATIAANMPASLAYYDVATRTTRLCSEGWPDIVTSINAEVDVVLGAQAASTFQGPDAVSSINALRDTINDFATFAGYASTAAEDHIKQAMLIASFDDAANRGISATGNAAALDHLQSARAEVQTRSSYQAVGSNALSWVPYLKIVFENLYYGAFPIALMLMMTPLCLTVARGYFGGFVWLASWEPLTAILHSLMMNSASERLQTITSASTGGAYTDSVMNWANHFGVYSVGQDVSVMAGYLLMSVPFVAAAIFFGTQKMVGLATSMLAVSQSAASQTGQEMATGNLSYGNASVGNKSFNNLSMDNYARNNASYDNVSANRNVTSPYSDTGRSSYFGPDGSMITTNANGSIGIDGGSSRVNTATNVALGNSVVSSLRSSAAGLMERGDNARQSYERSVSNITGQTSSFMQSITNGEAWTSGRGVTASNEEREGLTESISTLDRFAEDNGISRSTALEIGIHAGVRTPWKMLPVSAQSSLQRRGVSEESYRQMTEASRTQGLDTAVNNLTRASQDYGASNSSTSNVSGDKGIRQSIDDVERQARSAETYRRASESYSEAADRAESQFVDNRVDLSAPFADWMIDQKGMNAEQVSGILNGRGSAEQSASLRNEFSEQYINDLVAPAIADTFGTDLPAPQNPGAAAPVGEVHDHQTTLRPRQAEQLLQSETAIIQGSNTIPSIQSGASDVIDRASGVADRNEEANGNSLAAGADGLIDSVVGGGLVNDGNRVEWRPSEASAPPQVAVNAQERDMLIRTIAGEAGNQSRQGQVAVASVIRNRVLDDRHADTVSGVVTAPRQFSVWNTDGTGNNVGHNIQPGSERYERIGDVVDDVFSGNAIDPTGGATHYYSPKGMQAYVNNGHQNNLVPTWMDEKVAESGGSVEIQDHIFAGEGRNQ